MMTTLLRAAAAAALFSAAALPAAAQNLDFRIVNNSGFVLMELYVSPQSSNQWGNDVLGRNVIESPGAAMVRFPKGGQECVYDIRMVFNDGDVLTDQQNLCQIGEYTIN
jgi:hypothetical protein